MVPVSANPPQANSVDAAYGLVSDDLARVRQSLLQIVPPDTALLENAVTYAMQAGGKLLRPVIALLASGASGPVNPSHVEMAAVAELIHIATLLHDDVLDDADLRRGRATVRNEWGNKISILSGDYLLAQASLKLSRLDNCRLVSIFAIVLAQLCEGEVEQIRTSYDLQTTWESYFRKSICKTASLFAACGESAGVINGLLEPQIQGLRQFGEAFGIAFQVIDDLLDYTATESQLGKPVLDDLRNGLMTAPVLLAREHYAAGTAERMALDTVLQGFFEPELSDARLLELRERLWVLLRDADAVAQTQAIAERYINQALSAVAFLPESEHKTAMVDLARYVIERRR